MSNGSLGLSLKVLFKVIRYSFFFFFFVQKTFTFSYIPCRSRVLNVSNGVSVEFHWRINHEKNPKDLVGNFLTGYYHRLSTYITVIGSGGETVSTPRFQSYYDFDVVSSWPFAPDPLALTPDTCLPPSSLDNLSTRSPSKDPPLTKTSWTSVTVFLGRGRSHCVDSLIGTTRQTDLRCLSWMVKGVAPVFENIWTRGYTVRGRFFRLVTEG